MNLSAPLRETEFWKIMGKIIAALCLGTILAGQAFGQSTGAATPENSKLMVVSLEDIKKWNFQTTRKDIVELIDAEAVLFATVRRIQFKAKEGGAYAFNFFRTDSKSPYTLTSVYHYPIYPEEDAYITIMRDPTPLPKVPVSRQK